MLKEHNMTIWRDIPVLIKCKIHNVYKPGKLVHRSFCLDYGDVPCGSLNDATMKYEICVNSRGNAYAARNRMTYRKEKYLKTKYRAI